MQNEKIKSNLIQANQVITQMTHQDLKKKFLLFGLVLLLGLLNIFIFYRKFLYFP